MQRQAEGSGLCSVAAGATLTSAEGKLLASNAGSYSERYNVTVKTDEKLGWKPSCVLDPNYHGGFGKCKEFKWTRYVEVGQQCVKSTSWVKVPCTNTNRRLLT